ncbi:trigger factor [Aureibaculum sp. 2210JD6-5]|uniref:trigger factor n=1 Tax=Aureibaculum sp. 2210JD6-5 TaxID=3103957 RepID=UPI002AAD5FF9|nr:trigger factor [Aureibaculum sp. 2210JD6-5]MDY7396263.1 trigger factor [Aureibaculum sp. 2210JD6-5]
MNITKENIDDLNAVVKINITEEDYQNKVAEILQDYRKKANIPGFRKGHVPMSLVKKQYEKPVLIDEVNKLLQESLSKFLVEEKLDILGNPLPKTQEDFSWDADQFSFEFELGLVPEFEVNLQPKKAITSYKIVADKKMLNDQIANIQERYGKIISQTEIAENSNITGTFVNEEKEIEKKTTFKLDKIKGKTNSKLFIGAKVGDVITLKTKGLFTDDHLLENHLGVSHDDTHNLDVEVKFTVEEISETEPAELNQELFDKLFGEGVVSDEKEFRKRLKEDTEKQFEQQSDQQLLNAVTEALIENTKFDLPSEFLQKWIAVAGEKQLTEQEAEEEYNRSEKGLRYQLIEGKISKDNNLQVTYEELKEFAKGFIKSQMAQYGNANPEEKELEDIAGRILSNQEEAKRLSEQLMSQKLLTFYKENVKLKTKEVSFDDFVKEVYK